MINVNLFHVFGLAYALGAVHHFVGILKHSASAMHSMPMPANASRPRVCLMLGAAVILLALFWPITAAFAAVVTKKKGG